MSIEMIDIAPVDLTRLPEVTRALAANAERNDRTADFPAEGIRVVHQAGLLTATVAARYGGPGGGLPKTVARRTDRGWSVTGRKIFSTGAEGLRLMAVWARTDEAEPRAGSFLVRNDAPGITIERTWDHLGLRASRSDDVTFDATPALAAIPDARPDSPVMAWNSLGLSSLYLGVAAAARDWLIKFLSERTPASLGAPLATLPRFQQAVGEIESALGSAGDLVDAVARRVDDGDDAAVARAPAVKLIATRAAISSVEQALALTGNNGLSRRNPLERHYRDVLCSRVHTPQDDSIALAAGRAALGR